MLTTSEIDDLDNHCEISFGLKILNQDDTEYDKSNIESADFCIKELCRNYVCM